MIVKLPKVIYREDIPYRLYLQYRPYYNMDSQDYDMIWDASYVGDAGILVRSGYHKSLASLEQEIFEYIRKNKISCDY